MWSSSRPPQYATIFREKMTGTHADRPQLKKLMGKLTAGDVVIIPAVDRLSRDTTDLLVIAREMQRAGAGLRSLAEPVVDTTSDFAELVLAMLGVADPSWRVQTLVILFVVGLAALIFWELRHASPVVNFRPLRERNFAACCIIIFSAYAVLYASSTALPALLQTLFGYDALNAGLVMSPAGIFAVITMPFVGRALGRGTDARWVIAAGLLTMAAGSYWMSQFNLDISPGQAVLPRVVLIVGLAMCFVPANVAAYLYTPLAMRGAAVGLLSLLRNEGGSVGTSMAQTIEERRDQFHVLRLGEKT
jgi:hypothetical protein